MHSGSVVNHYHTYAVEIYKPIAVPGCQNGDFEEYYDYCYEDLSRTPSGQSIVLGADYPRTVTGLSGVDFKEFSLFSVHASSDQVNWVNIETNQGRTTSSFDTVLFDVPVSAQYFKISPPLQTQKTPTMVIPHERSHACDSIPELLFKGFDGCKTEQMIVFEAWDGCTINKPCQQCQGDCDSDDDCSGHLKCFDRSHTEAVPGCASGGDGDKSDLDVCYLPTPALNFIGWNLQEPLTFVDWDAQDNGKISPCHGDCDEDDHCAGNSECYRFDSGHFDDEKECGPTLIKNGLSTSSFNNVAFCTQPNPKTYGLCEGDCDYDSDCLGELKCYKQTGAVPGCTGLPHQNENQHPASYCYDENQHQEGSCAECEVSK